MLKLVCCNPCTSSIVWNWLSILYCYGSRAQARLSRALLVSMVFNPLHFHFAGQYVFIETSSPRQPGDNAYLISQPFDPTTSTGRCLKFWHHMKGASIGTLNVYIYTGNFSSMYLLWQRKGNKGNNWMLGQTPIRSSVKYQVKAVFRDYRLFSVYFTNL